MQYPNSTGNRCEWCGMIHSSLCPRIKAIEYDGGLIKRIEFHSPQPLSALPIDWTNPRLTGAAPAVIADHCLSYTTGPFS